MDFIRTEEKKESKPFKLKLSKNTKEFFLASGPYFTIATVILIFGIMIIDLIIPPKPPTHQIYVIFGFPVMVLIGNFLLFSIGAGWIIHGVGFLVIKR